MVLDRWMSTSSRYTFYRAEYAEAECKIDSIQEEICFAARKKDDCGRIAHELKVRLHLLPSPKLTALDYSTITCVSYLTALPRNSENGFTVEEKGC